MWHGEADGMSQSVRNQIAEAQKIASGSGSEQDIAEAKIELEVSFRGYLHHSLDQFG